MNLTGKVIVPTNLMLRQATRHFIDTLTREGIPNGAHYALMFWYEFGTQEKVWLSFHNPDNGPAEKEPTLLLIEEGVGWNGDPGRLVSIAIACDWLKLVKEGDVTGVQLEGFEEMNPHFVPGYKTMQQRGQMASLPARNKKTDATQAEQQRQLVEMQGKFSFEASTKELDQAYALIIRIDRIGKRKPRLTSEYTKELVEQSVRIRREHTPREIESMLTWLVLQRDKPGVLQGAEFVIPAWSDYMQRSQLKEGA